MIHKDNLIKIIKYINYLYLNNYIKNCLTYINEDNKINEWKIFSTNLNISEQQKDDQFNILNLVQAIINHNDFDHEIFLISIHIYRKICIRYAHLIDNYVYLFGSIYVALHNILCDKFLSNNFLSNLFDIKQCIINKMIMCIERFINFNDIYFGVDEKNSITNGIYYS